MSELSAGADSIPTDRTAITLATRESDTEPRLTLAAPLPAVCTVHGSPAGHSVAVLLRTSQKIGVDVRDYLLGGFLEILSKSLSRLVDAPAVRTEWPLCEYCERKRRRHLRGAAVVSTVGIVLVVVAMALAVADLRGVVATTAFLSGLIAQPVAVLLLQAVRPQKLLHATATPDGSAVIVTDPHPAFAAAVRDLQR
ncbi:hypothetical protein [Prescottella equi]|uniref:hypothetical protein n=1 Tax=Rhodococcus hoagii TaxID=43767 RepID=UPI0018DED901|nr:hypothetical protein [Prescottella equi]